MRYYIGIDPGQNGAIAILSDNREIYNVWDSSKEISQVCQVFKLMYKAGLKDGVYDSNVGRLCALEKTSAMPKQGVSSTFAFGRNVGAWEALLCAYGIPFVYVTPHKWQKEVFDSAGEVKHDKSRSLELARRLFPNADLHLRKHDSRAESLLIAEWLRRQK